MTRYELRLYVLGRTTRARHAEEQLRELFTARVGDQFDLEVIDVAADPERAEAERIVATPTLDRLSPHPRVRVIGDLSSEAHLVAALDLPALDARQPQGHS